MTARLTLDAYYLQMLRLVAGRSTCPRRMVGAIIVDREGHVLATGYNGVPRGAVHCVDVPCEGRNDPSGDSSRCLAVHAEINALLQCDRLDRAATIYVSCEPCFACAKALANTPIRRVVACEPYVPGNPGAALLRSIGVELVIGAVEVLPNVPRIADGTP